jgi:hypothetical protein
VQASNNKNVRQKGNGKRKLEELIRVSYRGGSGDLIYCGDTPTLRLSSEPTKFKTRTEIGKKILERNNLRSVAVED